MKIETNLQILKNYERVVYYVGFLLGRLFSCLHFQVL